MLDSIQVYVPFFSTVVVAIATVVLVYLTGRYVRLTRRLVEESKRLRDPLVTIDFETPDHQLRLVVANHGLSPARNIRVKLIQETDWLMGRGDRKGLAHARPFITGVSFLSPGRKLKYGAGFPDWRNIPDGPIEVAVEISYESLTGERFMETIQYDLRQLHGVLFESFRDPNTQIAEAIKRAEESHRMESRPLWVTLPATKRCSICDEEIREGAKKCKHCGSIQSDSNERTQTKGAASGALD